VSVALTKLYPPEDTTMAVETKSVQGRRQLHFNSLDDLLADVERRNQGKIRALGNWSPGQILKHLAAVMNGSIDGLRIRAPLWLRPLGWLFKKRILSKPMPPGFRLSDEAAKDLTFGDTTWEEGFQAFRAAVQRLKTESNREPSPFLGQMTREQWDQLHCRHAELHLSFLTPEP
jgi:hypothetical protein